MLDEPNATRASIAGLDEASKMLFSPARRWMMYALSLSDQCCASDLGRLLGYDRPAMSRYLKPLKELRLVIAAEDGSSRQRLSLSPNVSVTESDGLVEITISVPGAREASLVRFELDHADTTKFAQFAELLSKASHNSNAPP